jgi:hypothetical protein
MKGPLCIELAVKSLRPTSAEMIRLLVTMQLFLTVAVTRYRAGNQSRDACRLERAGQVAPAIGLIENTYYPYVAAASDRAFIPFPSLKIDQKSFLLIPVFLM